MIEVERAIRRGFPTDFPVVGYERRKSLEIL
jgi:hypothetical protein